MKKIKSKRQFFTGTLAMVLAALCLILVAMFTVILLVNGYYEKRL